MINLKLHRGLLIILAASPSIFSQETMSNADRGVRFLVALSAQDPELISIGNASNEKFLGIQTHILSFGGYTLQSEIDTGLTVRMSIPSPSWSDPRAEMSGAENIDRLLSVWDPLRSMGYPEWIRFASIRPTKQELKEMIIVRQRVCSSGIFYDESVGYSFYSDKENKRTAIATVIVKVSKINADEQIFEAVNEVTTPDEVRVGFNAVNGRGKMADMELDAGRLKIEQELFIAHENDFFIHGSGGMLADLSTPLRRVRKIELTVVSKSGNESSGIIGLFDPIAKRFVAGYPRYK